MKWTRQFLLSASLLYPTAVLSQDSICDKYTKALLKDNTAANQYGLLVKVVNTALIGNYTQPNMLKVNGILVPGQFQGKNVTLLPYFNGGLISTNRGGKAMAVNFIDDGGAIALAQDKPADGTSSNQYKLVTHLYEFFGALLGCSQYGKDGFPAYGGNPKMYELHKFMNLDPTEMGYFIQEVGLSAASFGVVQDDIMAVAMALNNTFNQRCSPKAAVLPGSTPDFQAICINQECPVVATGAVCSSYNKLGGFGMDPATATSTIGPQLTDLAPQLSSIAAGKVTKSGGGEMTDSGMASSMVETVTTIISTDGSVITSTFPTTVMNTDTESSSMEPSSVESTITSVITSGSSTFTSLIPTSVAATTPNAAAMQTAGPVLLVVLGAGLVGQLL